MKFLRPTAIIISSENIPATATLRRATFHRAQQRRFATKAAGVGPGGRGVYLDFADAIKRLGVETIRERYGNLFEVYKKITGEDAYKVPMRIYPACITQWAVSGWIMI